MSRLAPLLPFLNATGAEADDPLVGLGLDESVDVASPPSVRQLQSGQVFLGDGDGSEGGTVFQGPAGNNQFNLDDALDQFASQRPLSRHERIRAKSAISRGVDPETAIAVQQLPQRQRSEIMADIQRGLDPEVVRAIHSVGEFDNPRDAQVRARQQAIRTSLAEARREQTHQRAQYKAKYDRAKDILSKQGAWNLDTERQIVQQLNQEFSLAAQEPLSFPGLEEVIAEGESTELMYANLQGNIRQLLTSEDPQETAQLEATVSRQLLMVDDPQKVAQFNTYLDNVRAQRSQERQFRLDAQKAQAEAEEKRLEPMRDELKLIDDDFSLRYRAAVRGVATPQERMNIFETLAGQREQAKARVRQQYGFGGQDPPRPSTSAQPQQQTRPARQPITPRGADLQEFAAPEDALTALSSGGIQQGEEVLLTTDQGRGIYRRNGDDLDLVRELE